MASNTTSSIYGSGVSSNRIGGLMSGLDTEDLVKQMTKATQIKIDKQFQAQQKLVYQQDAFREVISKLAGFSDKYFSFASKTNILSSSFFKSNTVTSSSSNVSVSGDTDALKNFSIDEVISVASNARFTSNKQISSGVITSDVIASDKDINALAGQSLSLKNGKDIYTIKIDDNFEGSTIQDVADEFNKQIDKISVLKDKIKYTVDGDKLKLEKIVEGDIKVSAVGKEIEERLKIEKDSDGTSATDIDTSAGAFLKNIELKDILAKGQITFDYNNVQKTITFPDSDSAEAIDTVEKLEAYLQDKLNTLYGKNGDGTEKIEVGVDGGKLTFKTSGTNNLFGISSISADISKYTKLSAGNYNRVNRDDAISKAGLEDTLSSTETNAEGKRVYKISINNKDFTFTEDSTLNEIIKEINSDPDAGISLSHSATSDKFTAVSKETGAHIDIEIEDKVGNLAEALFGKKDEAEGYTVDKGTDTVINVTKNGVPETLTRSTSNIVFDGINIGLTNKAEGEKNISFAVSDNIDDIVENMAKFVNDYNEIITYLDSKLMETPNRKYPPLTDEQRKEMSESEIKLWDEKAKSGMLYTDPNISSLLYSLRDAVSGFVSGNDLLLANIGIAGASGDYTGKLVFNEDKFRSEYAKNPEKIQDLFTQNPKNATTQEKGIAYRIRDILTRNIGTMGEKGILVDKAGTKGTSTVNKNFLSERIKEYDDMIKKLKTKLEDERTRYWNQFVALENALSKLNSQSSWLASQFQ